MSPVELLLKCKPFFLGFQTKISYSFNQKSLNKPKCASIEKSKAASGEGCWMCMGHASLRGIPGFVKKSRFHSTPVIPMMALICKECSVLEKLEAHQNLYFYTNNAAHLLHSRTPRVSFTYFPIRYNFLGKNPGCHRRGNKIALRAPLSCFFLDLSLPRDPLYMPLYQK